MQHGNNKGPQLSHVEGGTQKKSDSKQSVTTHHAPSSVFMPLIFKHSLGKVKSRSVCENRHHLSFRPARRATDILLMKDNLQLYVKRVLSSLRNVVAERVVAGIRRFSDTFVSLSLSVELHMFDSTQTRHRCSPAHLLSLSSDLSDSLDHSPNAFALAQVCQKTELHLTAHRLEQRCTPAHLLPLFPDLSCALDHLHNAFALAQVAPQNRVAFDMVAERR